MASIHFDDEERALFDESHYPQGPNADFLGVGADGLGLVEKFAGGKGGGGGKFEDAEKRDIAAGRHAIVKCIEDVGSIAEEDTILDLGAGTGLLLKDLSALVPKGKLIAAEISPDFRTWLRARCEAEGFTNVQVALYEARLLRCCLACRAYQP